MFFARQPSSKAIETFLLDSRDLALSYAPAEISQPVAAPWRIDEIVGTIGRGRTDFERARTALLGWKQFDLGWVQLFPARVPAEAGGVVAVLVNHLGFWSLNGCRVLDVAGKPEENERVSVSYGTLVNHAESGQELFEVSMDDRSGDVVYRIHAVSRPRAAAARLGAPIVRRLQERFRADSIEAMKRTTGDA
jgi:uncharacterized protein (UPF0548 family)